VTRSYFVYYRSTATAPAVRAAVGAMQAALARTTGVQGRLLRRVDDDRTWMEIYEAVAQPEHFERELAAATLAARLETLLAPGASRHIERFTAD
jgi:Domain of unknown function (DUF4936)